MFSINNLFNNANMQCINQLGQYRVFEHQKDLSVSPYNAETAYFSAEMNVRRRQVLVELNNTSCKLQAGAMQWMLGNVSMQSGVSAGNFLGTTVYFGGDVFFQCNFVECLGAHEPYQRADTSQGRYDKRNDTCRGAHIGKGIVVGKDDATSCQKTGNADARNYE